MDPAVVAQARAPPRPARPAGSDPQLRRDLLTPHMAWRQVKELLRVLGHSTQDEVLRERLDQFGKKVAAGEGGGGSPSPRRGAGAAGGGGQRSSGGRAGGRRGPAANVAGGG